MHNTQERLERIHQALDILAIEGAKSYKPEARDSIGKWQKIGQAIAAAAFPQARAIAELAYEALEDMNHHDSCTLLDWAFDLYPDKYFNDLDRIARIFNRERVDLLTDWNPEKLEHIPRPYRIRLVIEPLEDK